MPERRRRARAGKWALGGVRRVDRRRHRSVASEYLIVTRDPGFLTLTGVWLTDHASTDIPTLGAIEAAALQANMLADAWQAWNLDGDVVQPQGAKMLPAVLSVGGWVAGVPGVLAANIVIGGVGMLAVYILARRFLGPLAALAPRGALALTVSHIGLSRSAYSEPLTLLLVMASIALGVAGPRGGPHRGARGRRRRIGRYRACAASTGASTRSASSLGVGVVCAWRGRKGLAPLLAFAIPQALMVGAGYWSLWRWSAAYIERLGDEARTLGIAYSAIVILVVIFQAAIAPFLGRLKASVLEHRNCHRPGPPRP